MAFTGGQLVADALRWRGHLYRASGDRFFNPPDYQGDCSGLIKRVLDDAGVPNDASAPQGGAVGYTSVTFQDWISRCVAARIVPPGDLTTARRTPGMIVCHGHVSGPEGHIAITGGQNNVVETPSAEGHWVGISSFDRNTYDFAGYIPGVVYPWGEGVAIPNLMAAAQDSCTSSCLGAALILAGGTGGLLELLHLAHLL